MLRAPIGVGYVLAFAIAPQMSTDGTFHQYEGQSDREEEQCEDESDEEEEQCEDESDGEEEQCEEESDGEEDQCIDLANESRQRDAHFVTLATEQAEEVLHISNNEEAWDVLRHMSRRMQTVFLQLLLSCDELDSEKIRRLIASIATQCSTAEAALPVRNKRRHTTKEKTAQAAAQAKANREAIEAMHIPVPPADADRMHQQAWYDAQARVEVALDKIDEALDKIDEAERELLLGRTAEMLIGVLRDAQAIMLPMSPRWHTYTLPSMQLLAQRAAAALQLVQQRLIMVLERRTKKAFKDVVQNLRDILMLCCRAQADIKDRRGFLAMAAQAYQTTCITPTDRAQLLLSYQKAAFKCGFASNNAYHNNRNGTRLRRDKNDPSSWTGPIKDPGSHGSASQEQGDPSSSCCAAATTSSNCTVASAAATSGSACAAAGSMSMQPTIYQDQQNGKGGGKGYCYAIMTANQEASWQANNEPWAECWATFPDDAAPGQPSLAELASANPCRYQYLMFLQQQATQYCQASSYFMEQSIWYANEYRDLATLHSYSQGQVHAAQTYSSAAADEPSSAAAAASSPPAATAPSSSAAAASSSSGAATPREQLPDFWMVHSTMEDETNPNNATDDEL